VLSTIKTTRDRKFEKKKRNKEQKNEEKEAEKKGTWEKRIYNSKKIRPASPPSPNHNHPTC